MLSCSIRFSAPSFWMGGGLESRCIGHVYCADGTVARHRLHRTHDLRSGSEDHHPSENSVQKTICCNSTSNALDDGGRTAPSAPYTRPTQRFSRPPAIQKLGAQNHMLQLNI